MLNQLLSQNFIAKYFLTLLVFLGIDAVWLSVIAKNMYAKGIGHLMSDKPNLVAALIFYALYPIGIIILALNPALREKSYLMAILLGGLLGFIAYSAYDLTNMATLKGWPLHITVIDIIWGTFLTALICFIAFSFFKQ